MCLGTRGEGAWATTGPVPGSHRWLCWALGFPVPLRETALLCLPAPSASANRAGSAAQEGPPLPQRAGRQSVDAVPALSSLSPPG